MLTYRTGRYEPGVLPYAVLAWFCVCAWATSFWEALTHRNFLLFAFDILIPPIGVICGALHWFGVI